jgi:hypothetical protein
MTDRVQIPAGITVTLQHLVLAHCSIGHEKPVAIFRFDQGSSLVINDTFALQPDNLCLPIRQQTGTVLHEPRPTGVAGVQRIKEGQPQSWCRGNSGTRTASDNVTKGNEDGDKAAGSNEDPASSLEDNNSYSSLPPLPQVYANRTGMGPVYAATLDQPAVNAYYMHHT